MEITFTLKDCLTIFNNYYLRAINFGRINNWRPLCTNGQNPPDPGIQREFGLSVKCQNHT